MIKKIRIWIYPLFIMFSLLKFTLGCNKEDTNHNSEVFLVQGSSPAWSPDGDKIAYLNDDTLYAINTDGKNNTLLATGVFSRPVWSPSGNFILYTGIRAGLYRINSDGTNKVYFTDYVFVPSWSPDGNQIAFVVSGLTSGLFLMSNDGTNIKKIASDPSPYQKPYWSEDGKVIMFSGGYDNERDIYLIDSDGSNLNRIVIDSIYEENVQMTSDGNTLYFSGYGNIYRINSDKSGFVNLTSAIGWCTYPVLSPDGSRIVFSSYSQDKEGLYIMDSNGNNLQSLVLDDAYDLDWSPDSRKVAYGTFGNGIPGIYIRNIQ